MIEISKPAAAIAAILLLAGCDAAADQAAAPAAEPPQSTALAQPSAPISAPVAAVEEAKRAIMAEPKVRDLSYRAEDVVQWTVAVEDDGSPRFGYAGYICQLLRAHGAYMPNSAVRVTDVEAARQHVDDTRSASLGAVRCSDEGRLDDAPAVG